MQTYWLNNHPKTAIEIEKEELTRNISGAKDESSQHDLDLEKQE